MRFSMTPLSEQLFSVGSGEDSLSEGLADLCDQIVDEGDRDSAARLLLDWIGMATAGSMTRQGATLRGMSTDSGDPCNIIAHGRANAEQACFVNGSYGTLLEMDDLHRGSILHAGDVVIPAALAAGQEAGCDGVRLLDAMVLGYEVALRIGLAAAQGGYSAWYNSGTCGIFGAAMAAAHAMKLSPEQKCDALGHAGMQASGLWQCRLEPTDSKCLATAHAARAGMTAARCAASGLRDARRILEGDLGFFPTLYPNAETSAVCAGRSGWVIHEVSLKPWPACRHVHPAIGAAMHLRPEVDVSAIEHVTVHSYAAGIAFCNQSRPTTPHEARFSFQHAIAVALLRGAPRLADFSDSAIADQEIARLRDRITVSEASSLTSAFPRRMGAVVDIVLVDGTQLTHAADHAPGDPEMPMSGDAVHEKFCTNLHAASVERGAAQHLIRSVATLKDAPSLCDLGQASRHHHPSNSRGSHPMSTIHDLKPAVTFGPVDHDAGWEPVPGGAPDVEQKMLSGVLDEDAKVGGRTRLIRFKPGTHAPDVFVHDYREEVYLMEGHLDVAEEDYHVPSYACRPPGTPHGPFLSPGGCIFFEIQYHV